MSPPADRIFELQAGLSKLSAALMFEKTSQARPYEKPHGVRLAALWERSGDGGGTVQDQSPAPRLRPESIALEEANSFMAWSQNWRIADDHSTQRDCRRQGLPRTSLGSMGQGDREATGGG